MKKFDVLIIGAGAAGLMCAIEAGKRGRSVVVIEHEEKTGKKILISGGGRCNFTNTGATFENFLSDNPHFCRSALANYTPADFISLVESHGIAYHEKKLGQLFCDDSSRQIVSMLEKECRKYDVKIFTGVTVKKISKKDFFETETAGSSSDSTVFQSESLVISSGGISIPKMGATGFGYDIAKQFGLKLTDIKPGLVPLLLNENEKKIFEALSGISIDSEVSYGEIKFRENILFTHKGLSGPAVLQISSYLNPGDTFSINLLPGQDFFEILISARKDSPDLISFVSKFFPKRFAEIFCGEYFTIKPLSRYSNKELEIISNKFHDWKITPAGTEGYNKAEVTVGGIDTSELSSKTMESKKIPGLFFIGEVVDVTGWLGGYNFQWAWASGFAAGKYA